MKRLLLRLANFGWPWLSNKIVSTGGFPISSIKNFINRNLYLGVNILGPFLKQLIPVLISGMRYSEGDIMALRGDEVSCKDKNLIFNAGQLQL